MKKRLALSCLLFVLPSIHFAATCQPYNNVAYTVQANGATGTMSKSMSCSSAGAYTINAILSMSKGFFSKQITQIATGSYSSPNMISVQTYTSSNDSTTFPQGDLDPLSLVLYLSSSLENSVAFSPVSLFYNDNTVTINCSVTNPQASVTIGTGTVVSATQVTCVTPDNNLSLSYTFSQDGTFTLLSTNISENGQPTLSTLISSL